MKNKKLTTSCWFLIFLFYSISKTQDLFPAETKPGSTPPLPPYTYTLAPGKADSPDEYSRKAIESFLCAFADNYIGIEDTRPLTRKESYVPIFPEIPHQKELAENSEIIKWFEETVTITSKGHVTILDRKTLENFFNRVNQVIGRNKFIYDPNLEIANIIVEISPSSEITDIVGQIGETSNLQDNWVVQLSADDDQIRVETRIARYGNMTISGSKINFTDQEKEFAKKERLVKIYIGNVLSPMIRHFSIIHELMHALGFPGHSPYPDSDLYPLPIRANSDNYSSPILSQISEQMIEMLYRPEIPPGMTAKEAGQILSSLKRTAQTPPDSVKTFLERKLSDLKNQHSILLKEGKSIFDKETDLLVDDARLSLKEADFRLELEEVKTDNHLNPRIVDLLKNAPSFLAKLIHIRREMVLLRWEKRKLTESGLYSQKKINLVNEQSAILKDIMTTAEKAAVVEQTFNSSRLTEQKRTVEDKLRKVLRQVSCIQAELPALKNKNRL